MVHMQCPTNLVWRKSTFSEAGSCVEIACERHVVFIRDSKNRAGPVLAIPISTWLTFIGRVKFYDFGRTNNVEVGKAPPRHDG